MHRLVLARSLALAGRSTTIAAAGLAARPLRSAVLRRPPATRRTIHVRVPLPYKIEDGMGDFLSPTGLKIIAEDYQQGLLDRLNEQIKGTNLENMSVAQIVISTAPHESQTLAFNYASLALNNSFFLHHLKPPTADSQNHEEMLNKKWVNTERTQTLGGVIAAQMGSLEDLKTYVTAAATGMLSSGGFVWLVTDSLGRLGIIATHGAGTLLVNERRQALSPNGSTELGGIYVPAETTHAAPAADPEPELGAPPPTATATATQPQPSSPTSGRASPPLRTDLPPGARTLSTSTPPVRRAFRNADARPANLWSDASFAGLAGTGVGMPPAGYTVPDAPASLDTLGETLYPLFCVSVHEHAWMAAGYGVWGMETYLERFWSCLDWAAVRDAYSRVLVRNH